MPLLDHFHAPLNRRPWESFHSHWISELGGWLTQHLPLTRYYCDIQTHLGTQVAADIAEFETTPPEDFSSNGQGTTALAVQTVPVATLTMAAVFPDDLEVRIVDTRDGDKLVAVVELISPGNLHRPENRLAFATKCAAYLQRGIGLMIIDIVTSHHFNLHNSLIELMGQPDSLQMSDDCIIYVVSYSPTQRNDASLIDFWPVPLAVGSVLPTMPLVLKGGPRIAIDLEGTYTGARRKIGI